MLAPLMTMSKRYLPTSFPSSFPYSLAQLTPHDPSFDPRFYSSPRFVNHIDDSAISALSSYYAQNLKGKVLDICSSWVSHIPLNTVVVVDGVGMNAKELEANPVLGGWVVHDLNTSPDLEQALSDLTPGKRAGAQREAEGGGGGEEKYDAVICNVSIDYLSNPLSITRSIYNVLRPGGNVFFAISNRCFPTKVGLSWRVKEGRRKG